LIELAGRVMGFIDGPASSSVDEHVRIDYRKRLTALLSPSQQKAFDEGYKAVQRRFAELDLDRQQTKADAKRDAQMRQERVLDDLKRESTALDREKGTLVSRADSAAADFKRDLAALDAQLGPLTTRQSRLEAQAAAIVQEIARLQAEIARLLDLSDLVDDPVDALRLRNEAGRLDAAWRRYDVDLRTTQGELAGVAAQRVTLAGQRQVAIARQRASADQIDRRLAELRRSERRISAEQDKATQPVSPNTPAIHSLASRAKAFTTYESFPFEEERARILQSLRDKP
jgi:chromosome segregation ATPase